MRGSLQNPAEGNDLPVLTGTYAVDENSRLIYNLKSGSCDSVMRKLVKVRFHGR